MNVTWTIAVVCGASVLLGCGATSSDQHVAQSMPDTLLLKMRCDEVTESRCTLWGPSLVELIARPELYDGKRVRVIGFVNFEFEGNGIYISQEDWRRSIARNGLWIDPPSRFETDSGPSKVQPNQRYVIVEGTFNLRNPGHLGMWSGAIQRVTRLEPWGEPRMIEHR
jgi:hypothetical protein